MIVTVRSKPYGMLARSFGGRHSLNEKELEEEQLDMRVHVMDCL